MVIMVDPSQVSNTFNDGLCPCRGCSVARKKIFNDIFSIIKNTKSKYAMLEQLTKYKESGYGIH